MARKKQVNHPPPKPKEFQIAPFSSLKGVTVPDKEPEPVRPPKVAEKTEPTGSGLNLFLAAVADVLPLHSSAKKKLPSGSHPLQKAAKKAVEELRATEENTFLAEIGRLRLDATFTDSTPDEDELLALSGNRLRQVKKGVVSVNHQLDLHGLTREEALDALPRFLLSAQKRGQKAVLVITGKGNHSAEEPVLHQAVMSWLREAGRAIVLEFAPAPRAMGGSGAFVVFLRQLSPAA
ncbi:MAG: Smr/MutS family protein [Desulfuromonadaceae bacterium]|nr:Smr/MutS family protein [Desulfuromonadaceae bacterium]MDD5105944.1 Smr/MutS family protein [Desulfuromonadaceae bacterium]